MIENLGFAKPCFRVISTLNGIRYLDKRFMYHIKAVIAPERFHRVTHSYPATLSIFNSTKMIYLNLLVLYEMKLKIKVTSPWTFS